MLHGGNCGIDNLVLQEIGNHEFLWPFNEAFHDQETCSDASTASIAQEDQIIQIQRMGGCYCSAPYIVPRRAWKKHGNPDAKDGEYRFVQCGDGTSEAWRSIRHYVGAHVVQLEVEAALLASKEPSLDTLDFRDLDRALDSTSFWGYVREVVKKYFTDSSWIDELIKVLREVERNRQEGTFPRKAPMKHNETGLAIPQKRTVQEQDDPLMLHDNVWNSFKIRIILDWEAGRRGRNYREVIKKPDDDEAAGRLVESFKVAWRERLQARKKRQLGAN